MSFFKFLKKKEGEVDVRGMDLPPVPGGSMPGDLSSLPPLEAEDFPPLTMPPPPPIDQEMPVKKDLPVMEKLPPIPTIKSAPLRPKIQEYIPSPSFGDLGFDVPEAPDEDIPSSVPSLELDKKHFSEEEFVPKRVIRNQGPLFIKMEDYREILESIENMRQSFKQEEQQFIHITDIKSSKDKSLTYLREVFEDLQRKLLFIDRTLFD